MAIWLGRCGQVDTDACYCEGTPIATVLTGEPASPCARSGKMIVHDNQTLSLATLTATGTARGAEAKAPPLLPDEQGESEQLPSESAE